MDPCNITEPTNITESKWGRNYFHRKVVRKDILNCGKILYDTRRIRTQLLGDVKERRSYWKLKDGALDRAFGRIPLWRSLTCCKVDCVMMTMMMMMMVMIRIFLWNCWMGIIWEMIESKITNGNNWGNTTPHTLHYWSEINFLVIRNMYWSKIRQFSQYGTNKATSI